MEVDLTRRERRRYGFSADFSADGAPFDKRELKAFYARSSQRNLQGLFQRDRSKFPAAATKATKNHAT